MTPVCCKLCQPVAHFGGKSASEQTFIHPFIGHKIKICSQVGVEFIQLSLVRPRISHVPATANTAVEVCRQLYFTENPRLNEILDMAEFLPAGMEMSILFLTLYYSFLALKVIMKLVGIFSYAF